MAQGSHLGCAKHVHVAAVGPVFGVHLTEVVGAQKGCHEVGADCCTRHTTRPLVKEETCGTRHMAHGTWHTAHGTLHTEPVIP